MTCLMTQPLPRVYHETRSERGETQVYAKRQSTKRKGEWTGPFLRVQKRESERGKVSLSLSLAARSILRSLFNGHFSVQTRALSLSLSAKVSRDVSSSSSLCLISFCLAAHFSFLPFFSLHPLLLLSLSRRVDAT